MTIQIRKAERRKARLRAALDGPSKSGKTMSALRLALLLGKRVGLIDAENGTSELYAGLTYDGQVIAYDVAVMGKTGPDDYTAAIGVMAASGYDALVIDGISPAWAGPGGMLEMHDAVKGRNGWADWLKVNPHHQRMINAIQQYPGHVIVTMRSVTEWVAEANAAGKTVPKKIGLKPQQRPMLEYEFDLLGSLDVDHVITITGSRCPGFDGATAHKPGKSFWMPLLGWLDTGIASVPVDRVPMATDAQMQECVRLSSLLGLSEMVVSAKLARDYQVHHLMALTEAQANTLLVDLRRQQTERQAGQATDPPPTPPPPSPPAPQHGEQPTTLQAAVEQTQRVGADGSQATNGVGNDPMSDLLHTRDAYFDLLGWGDIREAGILQKRVATWNKILAKRGCAALKEIPPAVIAELSTALEAKVAELVEQRRSAGVTCAAKETAPERAGTKS